MVMFINQIAPRATGSIVTSTGSGSLSAGGDFIFNIESEFGLFAAGQLFVRGNENGVNGTLFIWSWNIVYFGPTDQRTVKLVRITNADNVINNQFGQVFAYIPAFAGDRTNPVQSAVSTAPSVSDIFFRNGAGAACTFEYTVWRTS
jgi:hypothetical protein